VTAGLGWLLSKCSLQPGWVMQQRTSRQLYAYWDRVRNGRIAPRRFEIEPGQITSVLPETFIAEHIGVPGCRFRLVGTKICTHFGRELRGTDLLSLFGTEDRDPLAGLLRSIYRDAATGEVEFNAYTEAHRHAKFELLLLPLIHTGNTVNRILGCMSAFDPPFWLGATPLRHCEITKLEMHRVTGDEARQLKPDIERPKTATEIVRSVRHRFRVYQGGLE
jgi:hypothetical protein